MNAPESSDRADRGGNIEPGEEPDQVVARELLEETGYTADSFEFVQIVYSDPPRSGHKWYFYIAHGAHQISEQSPTEFEDLDAVLMSPAELIATLAHGKVANLPDMGLMFLGLQKLGMI